MTDELERVSYNVEKLIAKLQKRYPEYDFSQPIRPNRVHRCVTKNDRPGEYATDVEGNDFCIRQFKQTRDDNPYVYEIKTCYAILRTKQQKDDTKNGAF